MLTSGLLWAFITAELMSAKRMIAPIVERLGLGDFKPLSLGELG